MPTEPDLHPDQFLVRAAERLVPGARVTAVPQTANLVRVTTDDEELVVRRWADDVSVAQIDLIARTMHAASSAGVPGLRSWRIVDEAHGTYVLELEGARFTVGNWLAGRVLSRYGGFRDADGQTIDIPLPPSADALTVVMDATRVMAGVHRASRTVTGLRSTTSFTLSDLLAAAQASWSDQRRTIGQHAGQFPEIRRWLRCGNRVLPAAGERIAEATGPLHDRSVLLHGDLWPVHMLAEDGAEGRHLTGMVGWSSALAGSPLLDLAHLAVHSTGWSAANAESLVGAYTEVAPLRPEERRLLPVVAAIDLVGRVGHLLHLAFVDDRMINHEAQAVLRSGLKTLLISLETLTNVLAPEEEWTKRRFVHARLTDSAKRDGDGGSRAARPRRTSTGTRSGAARSRRASPPKRSKRG